MVRSKPFEFFFFPEDLPLASEGAIREERKELEHRLVPGREMRIGGSIEYVVERADKSGSPHLSDFFRCDIHDGTSLSVWHSTQHGTSGRKSKRFSGMGSPQPRHVPYVPASSRAIAATTMGRASSRFQSQWASGMVSSPRRATMSACLLTRWARRPTKKSLIRTSIVDG